jgi:hypothetical protein
MVPFINDGVLLLFFLQALVDAWAGSAAATLLVQKCSPDEASKFDDHLLFFLQAGSAAVKSMH